MDGPPGQTPQIPETQHPGRSAKLTRCPLTLCDPPIAPLPRAPSQVPRVPHLSWLLHDPWRQGSDSPCTTRASNRNLGAQKPRAPVTKAMAVTPRVDHTKLQLQEKAPNCVQEGQARGVGILSHLFVPTLQAPHRPQHLPTCPGHCTPQLHLLSCPLAPPSFLCDQNSC